MECDDCREAVSARLDGEPEPVPAARTDRHLAGCAACRAWQQQAIELTRRLRVRPAGGQPRVAERVLVRVWPSPSRPAAGRGWRVVLAAVAVAQFGLGAAQVAGWHAGMRPAAPMRGDMSAHLFDESTAWNIALSVGMAWVAWRTRAAAGMLPVFGGFLLLLTGFCVRDAMAGEVTGVRLAEHGLLVIVAWLSGGGDQMRREYMDAISRAT